MIFFFLSVSSFQVVLSQEGYHIAFTVKNLPDTVCFLVGYTGDKTYLIDTAWTEDQSFTFKGDTPLDEGMYMIAGQSKNKYLDFIVNDASKFRIETDTAHWIDNIRVKGSKENQLFFDYVAYLGQQREIVDSLNSLMKADSVDDVEKTIIGKLIRGVDNEVILHQKELIMEHQDTFFGKFLLASMEPEAMEKLRQNPDTSDRIALLREYRDHYWDNFDLTDDRLLHTPLFHPRMERYMDDLIYPVPDSITKSIDSILILTSSSKTVYEYLVWYFTLKYERSKIMGYDAVFVHMANAYFKTGKADFISEPVRQNIMKRSDILESLLIGKPAPLMILLDTNDKPVSLYEINKEFTVLYFWDTDCSFCTKETPKLKQFYDEYREVFDVEVYAVCIDTSMTGWKEYIKKNELTWINVNGYLSLTPDFHDLYDVHSSPVVFLLDRKKFIVGKNILTDQVIEILNRKKHEKEIPNNND